MAESWRLVIDGPVDGALNMALDRAVLLGREAGSSPPTLRLYRWRRPTATLGRFQSLDGVDVEFCDAHGIDVVRRPTGGRGVLHDDEITYSVVAGTADGVPRGTAASYRHLCAGLVATYQALGVDAALTARSRGLSHTAACYLHTTPADLSLGVAKLSGSAQVWHHDAVLQHGSFVISRDIGREARVFRLDANAAAKLADETATLVQALGAAPTVDDVIDAAVRGFADGLGIRLDPGSFNAEELERAELLRCTFDPLDVTPSS